MVNLFGLAPLVLSAVAVLAHPSAHHNARHNHQNIARANPTSVSNLEKRDFTGDGTWFKVGLGSCGHHSTSDQHIVALNAPQYAGGSHCGDVLYLCAEGNPDHCTTAVVMDLCPECASGSLDMSTGLFQFFHPLGTGRFRISWTWGSGPPPKPKPKPKPKPTTTHTTHTHAKPTHTSTKDDDKTSSTTESSSAPSSTPTDKDDKDTGNLMILNQGLADIGRLLFVAGH